MNRMESSGNEYQLPRTASNNPDSNLQPDQAKSSLPRTFDYELLNEDARNKADRELEKVNEAIKSSEKMLRFKYNDEVKQVYVEVINRETQEVVTSLPPEFLIDLSIKMKELIGLFIDKKL
ncbi:flagellar protein FlaG [Paenibacillus anaericanus]|nr:flagellar protein FlaG [Paenibacillus anaericanus]